MKLISILAAGAALLLGVVQASADQIFELDLSTKYVVSGPFDNAGGFVVGLVQFSGSPGSDYHLPDLNYPADQAGAVIFADLSGNSFNDGFSTNPGPGGFSNTGFIGISASDPFLITSGATGYSWYAPAAGGYFSQPLTNPTGQFTLTLPDYGDPWTVSPVVAAVPEPSTWAMMVVGFMGICFLSNRHSRGGLRLAS